MLPKIQQKSLSKELTAFNSLSYAILRKRTSQNNISELKMLKQFLQDQQSTLSIGLVGERKKITSSCQARKSLEPIQANYIKTKDKQNTLKGSKATDGCVSVEKSKQSTKLQKKHTKSIFEQPADRFKLNELFSQNTNKKCVIFNTLMNTSVKLMNNKLHTHRIL